jgi:polyribonucleotide nucleotidyltransferase
LLSLTININKKMTNKQIKNSDKVEKLISKRFPMFSVIEDDGFVIINISKQLDIERIITDVSECLNRNKINKVSDGFQGGVMVKQGDRIEDVL